MANYALQNDLFPNERDPAEAWIDRVCAALDDPDRTSGFIEIAEMAVEACPLDSRLLTLAATAALLDQRPNRALAFLRRISKRYETTASDHLLQAFALFQSGKRVAARALLERHGLTTWPAVMRAFPGGPGQFRWLLTCSTPSRAARHCPSAAVGRRRPAGRPPKRRLHPNQRRRGGGAPFPRPRGSAPGRSRDRRAAAAARRDRHPVHGRVRPGAADRRPGAAPETGGRCSRLRERLAHLGLAQGFDELLCLPHLTGVEPLWHQIETVRKVLKQFRGRVLLADEVGLGKTIEAGMVLKEYALRGMAERMLVLTPASLVGQWREELETKFGLGLRDHLRSAAARRPGRRSGARSASSPRSPRRGGASTPTASRRAQFDLVIVDEAHHLRDRIEPELEARRRAQQALPAAAVGDAGAERPDRALQSADAAEARHLQDAEGVPRRLYDARASRASRPIPNDCAR